MGSNSVGVSGGGGGGVSGGVSGGGGGMQDPSMRPLSRQGSLYSLTLDEVQNQIGSMGKPLGSMNLDELLKSVWSAEANNQAPSIGVGIEHVSDQCSQGNLLQKQPSFTLSRALSKKTVDEVWKEIQQEKYKEDTAADNNRERVNQDGQATLGEMTLEDFLSMAGVVAESSMASDVGPTSRVISAGVTQQQDTSSQHGQWMHYQLPSVQQQQNVVPVLMSTHHTVQMPLAVPPAAAPFLDTGFSDAQITLSPLPLSGAVSDTQTPGHKRVAPEEVVEKTVERRQKRMIKNRESAARSRARKQAYTQELENKVAFLEEENARLRKQMDLQKVLPCGPPTEPNKKLRRTSSAPAPF